MLPVEPIIVHESTLDRQRFACPASHLPAPHLPRSTTFLVPDVVRTPPARFACPIYLPDLPAQHRSIADAMGHSRLRLRPPPPPAPASIVSHRSQPAARHPIFSRFQPVEPVGCESPLTTSGTSSYTARPALFPQLDCELPLTAKQ
ncbi:hypothetical protein BTHE_1927 [Bifidobacterium thermophilum]|nr:hypothetical protein BTHE_1927 [Bifidobacterium thermophilum]